MDITYELPGWELVFDTWHIHGLSVPNDDAIRRVVESLKAEFAGKSLADHPVTSAIRKLFKQAGTDPTKYRPSFEALARRVIKDDPFPRINAAVDLSNLLSLTWKVPCCVADAEKVSPPVTLRSGKAGETMESLRGPFNLEGKPLLADSNGPYSTPITDNRHTSVTDSAREVIFVAYFPEGLCDINQVRQDLRDYRG